MICAFTRNGLGFVLALGFLSLLPTARAVTYTAANTFDLNPTALLGGSSYSNAFGAFGNQEVGYGYGGNTGYSQHALLLTGTPASAVDLNPSALLGTNASSTAYGTSGSQQIGYGVGGNTAGNYHALMWSGTAASAVDLNPASLLGTNSASIGYGNSGSQQVGTGSGGNTGFSDHALLWTGTAASAVDLHPAVLLGTNSTSTASGTSGNQQVGYGYGGNTSGKDHALLWSGTAVSAVDLNPTSLLGTGSVSLADGTSGGQQVGYGAGGTTGDHALLWFGTAESAVDLNPAALLGLNATSSAAATNGSQQVGSGQGGNTGNNEHALVWTGTAASAIDLHTLLPTGFIVSAAQGVDPYGNIVGFASSASGSHAVAWLAGDMYVGSGGAWVAGNWTASTPTAGNDVLLIQCDSTNREITYTSAAPAATLGQITIDATGAGSVTLSQSSGTLSSTNEIIGFLGAGTFTQTGGSHLVSGTITLAVQKGSQGTYNLSGTGALSAGSIVLNAGATFNQTGGTLYAGTFTQSGGTVTGTLQNQGSFIYQSGLFNGRLLNQGSIVLNAAFTATNGMENDASYTMYSGDSMTLNGAGLDNEGTLTISGGALNLNPAGNNVNHGNLNVFANLGLGAATLTNSGTLSLSSGLVSGAGGTLINTFGGTISGSGAIMNGFSNSGGLVNVGSGTLNISQPFISTGVIQLNSASANLSGGAINNMNMIQGLGNIENNITNNGTIQPLGGSLFISGSLSNPAAGILTAGAGSELFVTAGLAINAGIINLTGGIYDNGGHPLNNTGQISGWGIFRAGGTGLNNNGSITFSGGLTTVNGPVTNEGGRTITVAQNNAIFTGLVTNNANATFNAVNAVATFAGGFVNNGNSNFVKAGGGTVEIDAAPTLNSGSTLSVATGTLRFNVVSGAPTIGTGVTTVVSSGATLELAGSVSALANGPNRVNITNNSNAPGILVSGTNQQVGKIDGSGTTQVNAGASLTADHIIQNALIIGGTSKNPGLVTIDASDASGNPLASLAVQVAPTSVIPSGAGSNLGDQLGYTTNSNPLANSPPLVSSLTAAPAAVPEPSSLFMLALGGLALGLTAHRRHSRILNWKNREPQTD